MFDTEGNDCPWGSELGLSSKYLEMHLYFSIFKCLMSYKARWGGKDVTSNCVHCGYKTKLSKSSFLLMVTKRSSSQLGFQNQSSQRIYIDIVLGLVLLLSPKQSDT